tara:strand:- start:592 stop:858 length:267 start_codon:yes stop_codon:yes gene_type:complete
MTDKKIASQINGTQFANDLGIDLNVNGHNMGRGMYNLIVSIRDVSLYRAGMKPNRFWKITDVKKYFGIKGGADKCLEQLNAYKEFFTN